MTINIRALQAEVAIDHEVINSHTLVINTLQHELNGAYKILDMHQKQLQILVARIKQLEEQK